MCYRLLENEAESFSLVALMISKQEISGEPSAVVEVEQRLSPARRGKHKIFIGMAPGVGKTFRMLEEAQALKQDGIDVVIGLLETHGRKETANKAEGLEVVPRQQIPRGGLMLTEMDTEAILA